MHSTPLRWRPVDAFGECAGLRPHDRVLYYAAFIIDLDGNRIEAVTFPNDDTYRDRPAIDR